MTVKELITYLLNFDMSSEVVFVDQNNNASHITNDPYAYLGNGKYKTDNSQIKFFSTIIKNK